MVIVKLTVAHPDKDPLGQNFQKFFSKLEM